MCWSLTRSARADTGTGEGGPKRSLGTEALSRDCGRDGELVLQRCADGACAHLGERGCMIYEHRPSACRSFDCRVFSAMGLVEYCDPNHRIPDWEFAEDERGEH